MPIVFKTAVPYSYTDLNLRGGPLQLGVVFILLFFGYALSATRMEDRDYCDKRLYLYHNMLCFSFLSQIEHNQR